MQLNTTTDYAVRLLAYLAKIQRVTTSSEISKQMRIPSKYITNITGKLKKAGYITAFQGSSGGYILSCEPSSITLYDILLTMESGIIMSHCKGCDQKTNRDCILLKGYRCPIHDGYHMIHGLIEDAFRLITIQDIIDEIQSINNSEKSQT